MEFQSFIKELITTNEPPEKTEGQKIVFPTDIFYILQLSLHAYQG